MFVRAASVASELARSVRADQLGLATPCTEWDVSALLEHMAGGPAYLAAALGADDVAVDRWPDAGGDRGGGLAAWRSRARWNGGACRRPDSSGRLPKRRRVLRWTS